MQLAATVGTVGAAVFVRMLTGSMYIEVPTSLVAATLKRQPERVILVMMAPAWTASTLSGCLGQTRHPAMAEH